MKKFIVMGLLAFGTFAFANTKETSKVEAYGCSVERVEVYYDAEGNWEYTRYVCVQP